MPIPNEQETDISILAIALRKYIQSKPTTSTGWLLDTSKHEDLLVRLRKQLKADSVKLHGSRREWWAAMSKART